MLELKFYWWIWPALSPTKKVPCQQFYGLHMHFQIYTTVLRCSTCDLQNTISVNFNFTNIKIFVTWLWVALKVLVARAEKKKNNLRNIKKRNLCKRKSATLPFPNRERGHFCCDILDCSIQTWEKDSPYPTCQTHCLSTIRRSILCPLLLIMMIIVLFGGGGELCAPPPAQQFALQLVLVPIILSSRQTTFIKFQPFLYFHLA